MLSLYTTTTTTTYCEHIGPCGLAYADAVVLSLVYLN